MADDELKRLLQEMREENAEAHAETRRLLDATAATLREENAETRRVLEKRIDDSVVTLREENAEAHAETRRFMHELNEATRHEIQLVAEGVIQTREELGRVETKIETTAAETQAMFKFSHAELDRRMRTLEETTRTLSDTVADLQSRVERLEGSTH